MSDYTEFSIDATKCTDCGSEFIPVDANQKLCLDCKEDDFTPNLDGMDVDELREYFRNKSNPQLLRRYARLKIEALDCRMNGEISATLQFEGIVDGIYQKLPDEMKW